MFHTVYKENQSRRRWVDDTAKYSEAVVKWIRDTRFHMREANVNISPATSQVTRAFIISIELTHDGGWRVGRDLFCVILHLLCNGCALLCDTHALKLNKLQMDGGILTFAWSLLLFLIAVSLDTILHINSCNTIKYSCDVADFDLRIRVAGVHFLRRSSW